MEKDERRCKECNAIKNISEYPISKKVGDKKYLRHVCKKCFHKTKNLRRQQIRKQVIEYKSTLACEVCGYSKATHENFTVRALDFHHVNDNKEFSIGNGSNHGKSFANIKKEMDKCQVLCCRCHAQMHKKLD
jgi:hypothetical protein